MWKKAEKFLLKDKHIGPLVKKYGPCKIKASRKKDYFIDLVDAIASQQLSGKAARTIFERVKERCGGEITPEKLKKLKTEQLRKCGLSYAKCSYVKDLANKVLSGELKVKKLDRLSDEEVLKELIAVKGIGRWTAEMFLMFSLARPDVFPVDDLGIRKGTAKILKRKINPQKVGIFAQRWTPYRTAASWYIWKALEN
ncbi:MAG: DNA-3-methyladenine glycosylase [Patescibacteria group bacterium]